MDVTLEYNNSISDGRASRNSGTLDTVQYRRKPTFLYRISIVSLISCLSLPTSSEIERS